MPRNGEETKYRKKLAKGKTEKLSEESKRITEEATKKAIEDLLQRNQLGKTEGSSWANYSANLGNINSIFVPTPLKDRPKPNSQPTPTKRLILEEGSDAKKTKRVTLATVSIGDEEGDFQMGNATEKKRRRRRKRPFSSQKNHLSNQVCMLLTQSIRLS